MDFWEINLLGLKFFEKSRWTFFGKKDCKSVKISLKIGFNGVLGNIMIQGLGQYNF